MASQHRFATSAAPLRRVKGVQFGILSPEEIVSALHESYFFGWKVFS